MFTDMVGYTALMGDDERKALSLLERNFGIQKPLVHQFRGQWLEEIGDGALSSFESAVDAVYCALAIQQAAADEDFKLRIGLHLGDVVFRGTQVHGDGVNIASRVQAKAKHGGVTVSGQIYDAVRNHSDLLFAARGVQELKNVAHAVLLYDVQATRSIHPESPAALHIEKSIAVLPFANLSSDEDNEYFSDGMSEELLNALSRLSGLRVAGRTSCFAFKGKNEDLRGIGRQLNVSHILEGSVRKSGNRIRVTAQLIKTEDGFHVWSEQFDRDLHDIFVVQDEIAKSIARALKADLTTEASGTDATEEVSVEAYTAFIEGKFHYRKQNYASMRQAIQCYERALALAPTYVPALVDSAEAWMWLGHQEPHGELDDCYTNAKRFLEQAEEIDANDPNFLVKKGFLLGHWERKWREAGKYLLRAVALDPHEAGMHTALAVYLRLNQQHERALEECKIAVGLDPLNVRCVWHLAATYYEMGNYDEALREYSKVLDTQPETGGVNFHIGLVQFLRVDLDAAEKAFTSLPEDSFHGAFGQVLLATHQDAGDKADRLLDEFKDKYGNAGASFQVAIIYALRGQIDESLNWLEEADRQRDPGVAQLNSEPLISSVRAHPRAQALMEKYGLS